MDALDQYYISGKGYAEGGALEGLIPGTPDPSVADDTTINAKKGEYIIPDWAVAHLGTRFLDTTVAKVAKDLGIDWKPGPKAHNEPDSLGRMDKPGLPGGIPGNADGSSRERALYPGIAEASSEPYNGFMNKVGALASGAVNDTARTVFGPMTAPVHAGADAVAEQLGAELPSHTTTPNPNNPDVQKITQLRQDNNVAVAAPSGAPPAAKGPALGNGIDVTDKAALTQYRDNMLNDMRNSGEGDIVDPKEAKIAAIKADITKGAEERKAALPFDFEGQYNKIAAGGPSSAFAFAPTAALALQQIGANEKRSALDVQKEHYKQQADARKDSTNEKGQHYALMGLESLDKLQKSLNENLVLQKDQGKFKGYQDQLDAARNKLLAQAVPGFNAPSTSKALDGATYNRPVGPAIKSYAGGGVVQPTNFNGSSSGEQQALWGNISSAAKGILAKYGVAPVPVHPAV